MEKTILKVDGMSCHHCVNAVTKAVEGLEGVSNVLVDLDAKTVSLEYESDKVTLDSVKEVIEDEGYDVI
jgi:copper chaperone